MPPRGNPGENHTKNISSLTGKAIRHAEDEGETSVKKRRYGNVLVAPTPDITASSTDESDVTEVFPSERRWRSFATEYNCHVRLASVALKGVCIKVHLKENHEDNEWMIVIEDTKEFPDGLQISALAVEHFAYVEKSLFIITPTAEFFQRTLDNAPAIADLLQNGDDALIRCILITFDKDSSDLFAKFGRKVREGRIHAVKLSEEDGKRCLKEAIGADAKLAKAVASLSQSKAAESTVNVLESEQSAPSCPNPFSILVDLLGVAAFLGKEAILCFVPTKRALKIFPSKYARPKSYMCVDASKFEYYQYDHNTGAFHLSINDNSAADIAQELIKLSDAKDLMEPGVKCRGSAIRAILNETVNPVWLGETLDSLGIPHEELPKDNLAKALFPNIKDIGLPRALHVNGTSVKGPLDDIVPVDNSLQPEKSHLNPVSVPTRPNKPKTIWPTMVSAPKDVRQSNGLLPPSNIDLRMFDTSQHPSLRKDTSNAARNPKLSRSVHVPTAPRQRTLRNDSTKENKKMRTIENELPGSLYSYESRPVAVIPLSSQRARLNARSNPQISVTVAQSDKSVTKLIIDTKYLQNPFKKSIIDALIERMEQATVSGNPRRSITSGSQSNAIVPNPIVSNGDPVCIDLSEDDEPNSSGSGDLMGSSAFVAECPDGAHEIFRDVHLFDSVKLGNGEITAGEIFQLAKGQQLGDGVVQFLLEFFDMSTPRSDRIHVFSYFFFQSYLGAVGRENQSFTVMTEAVYRRLLDHTRKVDLFSCRYLVIPVLKDQHWYLAIVCSPNPLMEAETKKRLQAETVPGNYGFPCFIRCGNAP
ncbi:uncharacterized protein LOC129580655 [Paramacrobiotus metropolitanus]|uniref:uncharacterized protein LOC129580655 n=1 Tax=Paramacrobiotus metropolitanus TaxID=2943436 RepID=UPI0024455EB6|nr:uncharacterized protein LOC129580655 [Paramacrobiotus metropolitanus]